MSTEAVQRAFEQDRHTGTRAQVLTYICWRADKDGVAWPKRTTIAEAVNVSEKQVTRHVKALVESGDLWYRPGRGRGNASTYVPTVGLPVPEIRMRLGVADVEKGDAARQAQAQLQRRAASRVDGKPDTYGGKGDTQPRKGDADGGLSEKGTSEKRGHSGEEKATPAGGFSDPPNDNISNPPESKTMDRQTAATSGAGARGGDPFEVEIESVDAITEAAFGDPIRGLATKDEIRSYCERAGPEGWDALRAVCETISRKGWNPTAALVKTKLRQQIEMLDESDDSGSDDFASQAQRLFEAAGRGAGAH